MLTITLDLEPETEDALRRQATVTGQNLESLLANLARREASLVRSSSRSRLTLQEFERLSDELADLVDSHVPLLSDEAVSRESIYAGRG